MVCNWLSLLFRFPMALFHLFILMNAKNLKSVFSKIVHGIAKHSREYNAELIRPKLPVVTNELQSYVVNLKIIRMSIILGRKTPPRWLFFLYLYER
jgi:hypothetical protein